MQPRFGSRARQRQRLRPPHATQWGTVRWVVAWLPPRRRSQLRAGRRHRCSARYPRLLYSSSAASGATRASGGAREQHRVHAHSLSRGRPGPRCPVAGTAMPRRQLDSALCFAWRAPGQPPPRASAAADVTPPVPHTVTPDSIVPRRRWCCRKRSSGCASSVQAVARARGRAGRRVDRFADTDCHSPPPPPA
jgi:hypothetical protein